MNVHDAASPAPLSALTDRFLPPWFDEGDALYGAPNFIWRLLMEPLPPDAAAALQKRPALLKIALVVTWRQWRRRCIAAEWRP